MIPRCDMHVRRGVSARAHVTAIVVGQVANIENNIRRVNDACCVPASVCTNGAPQGPKDRAFGGVA